MARRSPRVSPSQWDIMLDFLWDNPALIRSYNNSSKGRWQTQRLWGQLADLLNSEESGTSKTAKEWAIYFNNFKSKLKKTVTDLNIDVAATVAGPDLAESLSELEIRVLSLLGPRFSQRLPAVKEAKDKRATPEDPLLVLKVESFPAAEPSDHDYIVERASAPVSVEVPEVDREDLLKEDVDTGSGSEQVAAEEAGIPEQQEQPSRSNKPPLPRRTRRIRYRSRPKAPIAEALRLLSQVELQRAAADAANARALELIGQNLGRIANALEIYVAQPNGARQQDN